MKQRISLLFIVLLTCTACDRKNEESSTADPENIPAAIGSETRAANRAANNDNETLISPADLSEQAQATMYQHISDYNRCMMTGRLNANQDGQQVQSAANAIMEQCNSHLDTLETHLLAHNVNKSLAIGMTKKMRSRGARQLMTKSMNNMAAQAMAVENAEKIKATQ